MKKKSWLLTFNSTPLEEGVFVIHKNPRNYMKWKKKRSTQRVCVFFSFLFCPLKCLMFENLADALATLPTLFGVTSSVSSSLSGFLHTFQIFPIMHLSSKKTKGPASFVTVIYYKPEAEPPTGDGSMCLFVSPRQDFHYNSFPVYPSLPSSSDGGGWGWGGSRSWLCVFFSLFNGYETCTQSFNLPYLSHVTV